MRKKIIIISLIVIVLIVGAYYTNKSDFYKQNLLLYYDCYPSTNSSTTTVVPSIHQYTGIIHIGLSVDSNQFIAVPTFINSLIKNSNRNNNIVVHIIATDNFSKLKSLIDCCNVNNTIKIFVQEFHLPNDFTELIKVTNSGDDHRLSSAANFARFFFHQIYPNLTHLLYLDVDSIINHDITNLWLEIINGDQLMTTITIPDRSYGSYLKPHVGNLYHNRYAKSIDMTSACLMGGVYGVNLQLWREKNIHKEILYWMKEHQRKTLWSLGTQPLLMIVGYKRAKIVSYKWNLTGLGWYTKYTAEQINRWHILHWNGKRKPWLKDGLYQDIWNQYTPKKLNACMTDNPLF